MRVKEKQQKAFTHTRHAFTKLLLGIIRYRIGYITYERAQNVGQELLKLIAEIDEFKGKWEALKNMSPEKQTLNRTSPSH